MKTTPKRLSESAVPQGRLARDVRRLKKDGSASLAELKEFVGRMHGKSPQEMLGTVAKSRLAICILISTVGCAVLLVTSSVSSYYFLSDDGESNQKTVKTAVAKSNKPTAKVAEKNKSIGSQGPSAAAKSGKTPDYVEKKTGAFDIDKSLNENPNR